MKLHVLLKVAGNPKVKHYWQMLKRLYGGTENTVKELSHRRDFGIYHGTSLKNVDNILKDKLKPGYVNHHGKGVYLGSRDYSEHYNKGALLRLKYPQELSKKENYPKITSILKHDKVDKKTYVKIKRKNPNKDYHLNKVYGIQGWNDRYDTNWVGQMFSRKPIKSNLLKKVEETPEEAIKWKNITEEKLNRNPSTSRKIGNPSDSSTWKSHYYITDSEPALNKFNGDYKNKKGITRKWWLGLPQ